MSTFSILENILKISKLYQFKNHWSIEDSYCGNKICYQFKCCVHTNGNTEKRVSYEDTIRVNAKAVVRNV